MSKAVDAFRRLLLVIRGDYLFSALLITYALLVLLLGRRALGAWRLVDVEAISLIYSVMVISSLLEESGLFAYVSVEALRRARSSPRAILYLVVITALSAAIVMNDTSMFMYVPVALSLSRLLGVDAAFLVSLVAMAANIGSALTPIGNPQNIVIWRHYDIGFTKFIYYMAPLVLIGLVLLLILVALSSHGRGEVPKPPPVRLDKALTVVALSALVIVVALSETGMALIGVAVSTLLALAARPRIMAKLDYLLLASFALMFMDFGLVAGLVRGIMTSLSSPSRILLVSALLSQAVSNVPATILLIQHVRQWIPLAYGVNVGGVGLVTGSMANIIAVRLGGIKVKDMHRYTLPYFAAALAAAYVLTTLLA